MTSAGDRSQTETRGRREMVPHRVLVSTVNSASHCRRYQPKDSQSNRNDNQTQANVTGVCMCGGGPVLLNDAANR